jgi:putative endopeptidase
MHPLSEFYANGIVKNFDEFHGVFNTKPGDAMYMPAGERVKMW